MTPKTAFMAEGRACFPQSKSKQTVELTDVGVNFTLSKGDFLTGIATFPAVDGDFSAVGGDFSVVNADFASVSGDF